eukprot:m.326632 g.326632  ORF g.326632 m.326632 type:complete len:203 (-) comp16483_c0_seq3:981-1589(-)
MDCDITDHAAGAGDLPGSAEALEALGAPGVARNPAFEATSPEAVMRSPSYISTVFDGTRPVHAARGSIDRRTKSYNAALFGPGRTFWDAPDVWMKMKTVRALGVILGLAFFYFDFITDILVIDGLFSLEADGKDKDVATTSAWISIGILLTAPIVLSIVDFIFQPLKHSTLWGWPRLTGLAQLDQHSAALLREHGVVQRIVC